MPKGSQLLTAQRRDEIINACERLYAGMSFKEITLKEISRETSFSRPSIYNYFQTKEEIFLALFEREYERWIDDLEQILDGHDTLDKSSLAHELALSLERRKQLLKLLSMNHYDMEENSRLELLTSFKVDFGRSMKTVGRILEKFCSYMDAGERESFLYVFFPFIYGIYPYAIVTEKQSAAMKAAEVDYVYHSIYELAFMCISKLLNINNNNKKGERK
ncbi:MAG: TetR family transcriptional regulator [Clostridia bacterium]|nr:TetR family transcriptional regulator [Clostridia bacterium]